MVCGLAAAVPFYGGQPSAADAAKIKTPILAHYGELDTRITSGWPAFDAALTAAHVVHEGYVYKGANHGFHNDTPPRYDEAPAARAPRRPSMYRALGLERLVLGQASLHGADISAVLDAVASDPVNLRGVATMSEETTDRELTRMRDGGIRGIRVNLVDRGGMPFRSLAALAHAAERIRDHAMHIELLVQVESFPELRTLAKTICVPMSVGHIGYTKAANGGLDHPGYQEFLALLRDGYFWVKLTGPYRISQCERFPYTDIGAMAKAVIAAAPDRVLWGSDWPHVMVDRAMPTEGDLIEAS